MRDEFNLPVSRKDNHQILASYTQAKLPEVNPFLKSSVIDSILTGLSDREYDTISYVRDFLIKQTNPLTATGEYLDYWASWFGITRKPAVNSAGIVSINGIVPANIPSATEFVTSASAIYESIASSNIVALAIPIISITRVGSLATATIASGYNLASNLVVSITGATQTQYNVTSEKITVISPTQFTFGVSGSPVTPATGSPVLNISYAEVQVQSVQGGSQYNIDGGGELFLSIPIANVEDSGYVYYGGIIGGLDEESDEELRQRLLTKTSDRLTPYNTPTLISTALNTPTVGATRAWVNEATPTIGQFQLYFVLDEQSPITPNLTQINLVRNELLAIRPATTNPSSIWVLAPTLVPVNITIDLVSPDTTSMRSAITANLQSYFATVDFQTNVSRNTLISIIENTVDISGSKPTDFNLINPASNVIITSGQMASLGTISFT